MAKAVRRKRGNVARRRSSGFPRVALLGALAAAALLAIAALLFLRQRDRPATPPAAASRPAAHRAQGRPVPARGTERFEFYRMLPRAGVTVPANDNQPRAEPAPPPVQMPGSYVLLVGSFATTADADHARARLGTLGIRAEIQDVTADDRAYHRLRVGPVEDLAELNRMRRQLRDARLEATLVRAGD